MASEVPGSNELIDPESVAYLGITVCVTVLVTGTLIVHGLRYFKIGHAIIPDSWVFLAIGAIVAVILEFGAASQHLERIVDAIDQSFSEIFFTLLLPPVIFQSGLELNVSDFAKRFTSFSVFAFLGTFMSAFVIGTLIFIACLIPGLPTLTYVRALIFGTILSATDTVAVIAVFEKLHVQEDLYAMVFGESVFNDAVAIVMYRTLCGYEVSDITASSVFKGIGMFLANFIGSTAIGITFGVLSALLFKHVRMHAQKTGLDVEKALLLCTPFMSYMLSEGLHISGVVAILFTGITMNLFTLKNVTSGSRRFVKDFYRVFSMLCEALVFVYIGIALPLLGSDGMKGGWIVAILLVLFCMLGRACSTTACSYLVNRFRTASDKISKPSQFIIWMAGLRGGVAFALASAAKDIITDPTIAAMFPPVTLFIVLVSMMSISSTMARAIRKFGLQGAEQANNGTQTLLPRSASQGELLTEIVEGSQTLMINSGGVVSNTTHTGGPEGNSNAQDANDQEGSRLVTMAHQAATRIAAVAQATLIRKPDRNGQLSAEGVELLSHESKERAADTGTPS